MSNRLDDRMRGGQSVSITTSLLHNPTKFLAELTQVLARNEPPRGQTPTVHVAGKSVATEPGSSLWGLGRDYYVPFNAIVAANSQAKLHVGDIVSIPWSSPELVARSKTGADGVPKGEPLFVQDLFDRGRLIANTDGVDYQGEASKMKRDVGVYLDSLSRPGRQAAAIRLATHDWTEGGPASWSVREAISERGLKADPEAAYNAQLREKSKAWSETSEVPFADLETQLATETVSFASGVPVADQASVLQRLFDENWDDAGPAQGAIVEAARRMGVGLRASAHGGRDVEPAARKIVDQALQQSDPNGAYHALAAGYANAAPEVRRALRHSPEAMRLIEAASRSATEPLRNYDPRTASNDQGAAADAMLNLRRLVDGADPDLAVRLLSHALPTLEAANSRRQQELGGPLIGNGGLRDWMAICDRISGAPGGDALIKRVAAFGGNNSSVKEAIANGASLDYPLALSSQLGPSSTYFATEVFPGVRSFADAVVGKSVGDYANHVAELQWLIRNIGSCQTPAQTAQAIKDYTLSKGAGWSDQANALEGRVAADGKKLLSQLGQLAQLPPESGGAQTIADVLSDDKTFLAVKITLQQQPELFDDPRTDALARVMHGFERGRKLLEEATTQIVRKIVVPVLSSGDPEKVGKSLAMLKDSNVAKLLGIPKADLARAVDSIERSIPAGGEAIDKAVENFASANRELNALTSSDGVRAFDSKTRPGQLLRFVGVAASVAVTAHSSSYLMDDPSLKASLETAANAIGLSQRVIEFGNGIGMIGDDTAAVKYLGSSRLPAAKVAGVFSAGLGAWTAVGYFENGDALMGTLEGAAAAGGVVAALGTGTIAGPIGLAVVLGALAGQYIVTGEREASKFETDAARQFATHGLSKEVADVLIDQSDDGNSVAPLLAQYARAKGVDPRNQAGNANLAAWLNGMKREQVEVLVRNLQNSMDSFDGDASRLAHQAGTDPSFTRTDLFQMNFAGSRSTASKVHSGDVTPVSVAQLDVVIAELGIPALT
ncbi:peptidoglycan-binding protein LysM [Ensifer sp. ENS02]|uniref:peptidoglycan-binding protein LysM n=1 Tax=Ensifer sp. ENS02 TaxID=2769290 RepID=UPI0017810D90|nr:peptidoglycan-binding protein LysM [Ensifer sp. ENS02]MBD9524714.1 peptidoglycan-binding protein LysM [Ensifer sp. ENS02]